MAAAAVRSRSGADRILVGQARKCLSVFTFPPLTMGDNAAQERALTKAQVKYCRGQLEEYAALDVGERNAWINDFIRDVWLLENQTYDWTRDGPPSQESGTSFAWTRNVCTVSGTRTASSGTTLRRSRAVPRTQVPSDMPSERDHSAHTYRGPILPSADRDIQWKYSFSPEFQRVERLLLVEGTKDLSQAVEVNTGRKWTAQKVFTKENKASIMKALYKDHPEAEDDKQYGHLPYYATYKTTLFEKLDPDEKSFYASLAKTWNEGGAPQHVKDA